MQNELLDKTRLDSEAKAILDFVARRKRNGLLLPRVQLGSEEGLQNDGLIRRTERGEDKPVSFSAEDWKKIPEAGRHREIFLAKQEAILRYLIKQGTESIRNFINTSNKRHFFWQSRPPRPEDVKSAKDIQKFLGEVRSEINRHDADPKFIRNDAPKKLSDARSLIDKHEPAHKSDDTYKNMHAQLKKMAPSTEEQYQTVKKQYLEELSSTKLLPGVLNQMIGDYFESTEELHGRDVDDHRNADIETYTC